MRRVTVALPALLLTAGLFACTGLLPGTDIADGSRAIDPRADARGPSDPRIDAAADPAIDSEIPDRRTELEDGSSEDAELDASGAADAGDASRRDAEPSRDASDAGPVDAVCSGQTGASCFRPGYCGAAIGCDGQCRGGSTPPVCRCATPLCQADGRWSSCPDPMALGQACSAPGRCGATIACDGSCQGGNPIPTCHCRTPTCQATGQWTPCGDPPGYGTPCNTTTRCGATIGCSGTCEGGTALPTCQCGTPTCAGCAGGTCGASSTCVSGMCRCTVNECACPAMMPACRYCAAGALRTCTVDTQRCGAFSAPATCAFGCTPGATTCNCSPLENHPCVVPMGCACDCGDFDRPGVTNCDGTCRGTGVCATICRQRCGICVPPRCLP